jgi:hypothetical protein
MSTAGRIASVSSPPHPFTVSPTDAIRKKQSISVEIDDFLSNTLKNRFKIKTTISLSKKYQDNACQTFETNFLLCLRDHSTSNRRNM